MQRRLFVAGVAMVAVCGSLLVVQDLGQAAADQAQQLADQRAQDELSLARMLPASPPEVALSFVVLTGQGGAPGLSDGERLSAAQEDCADFTLQAAAQFALTHGAPSCVAAMRGLEGQVTDAASYVNDLTVPKTAWAYTGDTATVNACVLTWTGLFDDTPVVPGPQFGHLTVAQVDGLGWQITEYRPC